MNIKFGYRQLGRPTPADYDRFVKIWIGIIGLILAWIPTNNIVPLGFQEVFTPIVNLVNSIMIFLLSFFGVQVETKTVKISEVKTIENPHNKD